MIKNSSMKAIALIVLACFSLSSCATLDLKMTRKKYASEKYRKKVQDIADLRSQQISENNTFYGKKLQCLSDMHKDFFMASQQAALQNGITTGNGRFRISVAPMRDKTGKVFEGSSTVLSDMVMDSVMKFKHFDVVETPLAPDNLAESRNNFIKPTYNLPAGLIQGFAATMTSLQHMPIGVMFPSNYYISGAITQYDETNVIPNKDINADLDAYQFSRGMQAMTVSVNLRLIDSDTGTVVRVAGMDDLAGVNLTNTFYSVKNGHNFFRLIGTKDYGIDYSVQVGDPKMAAVKEIIDKGVYELLDKFLKPYQVYKDQNC